MQYAHVVGEVPGRLRDLQKILVHLVLKGHDSALRQLSVSDFWHRSRYIPTLSGFDWVLEGISMHARLKDLSADVPRSGAPTSRRCAWLCSDRTRSEDIQNAIILSARRLLYLDRPAEVFGICKLNDDSISETASIEIPVKSLVLGRLEPMGIKRHFFQHLCV